MGLSRQTETAAELLARDGRREHPEFIGVAGLIKLGESAVSTSERAVRQPRRKRGTAGSA